MIFPRACPASFLTMVKFELTFLQRDMTVKSINVVYIDYLWIISSLRLSIIFRWMKKYWTNPVFSQFIVFSISFIKLSLRRHTNVVTFDQLTTDSDSDFSLSRIIKVSVIDAIKTVGQYFLFVQLCTTCHLWVWLNFKLFPVSFLFGESRLASIRLKHLSLFPITYTVFWPHTHRLSPCPKDERNGPK